MQWLNKCFLDCNDQPRLILNLCNEYQLEGKAKAATWHRQPNLDQNLEAGGREKLSHKPWQKKIKARLGHSLADRQDHFGCDTTGSGCVVVLH